MHISNPTRAASIIFLSIFLYEYSCLVDELEALETPKWAAEEILRQEICTRRVIDPNCGKGALSDAAMNAGYDVTANDIFNWGYEHQDFTLDFLSPEADHHIGRTVNNATVIMNPPFKLSVEFFEKAKALGARKIIMFQNFSFKTSIKRREFWAKYPPSRMYICAERATCWRFDIPEHKRRGTTSKTFCFYVWDGFNNQAPTTHLIYKPEGRA